MLTRIRSLQNGRRPEALATDSLGAQFRGACHMFVLPTPRSQDRAPCNRFSTCVAIERLGGTTDDRCGFGGPTFSIGQGSPPRGRSSDFRSSFSEGIGRAPQRVPAALPSRARAFSALEGGAGNAIARVPLRKFRKSRSRIKSAAKMANRSQPMRYAHASELRSDEYARQRGSQNEPKGAVRNRAG